MNDDLSIPEALTAIRRLSTVGRTLQRQGPVRYVDLYHRGTGLRFQMCAQELADTLRLGAAQLQDPDQMQRIAALIAWLEAQ